MTFRVAAGAGTEMPSGAVPEDTADRMRAPAAVVGRRVWDRAAAVASVVAAVVEAVGAGRG